MCPTGTSLAQATPTSEFRHAFDVIDVDHDGKIGGDDLRRFYASFAGAGRDDDMIQAMISVADDDKDGYVQYDEFERVLDFRKSNGNGGDDDDDSEGRERGYGDGGVMEDIFRVMDRDGDGRLGFDDLKSYLGRAGLVVEDEEIKAMIRLGGEDERKGVSFDGLVNILSVHDLVR